jgi:hypothetical protein
MTIIAYRDGVIKAFPRPQPTEAMAYDGTNKAAIHAWLNEKLDGIMVSERGPADQSRSWLEIKDPCDPLAKWLCVGSGQIIYWPPNGLFGACNQDDFNKHFEVINGPA